MKGKGAASLYEVLKTASRPAGDPAGAVAAAPAAPPTSDAATPAQTLQERLAAYKAQKLAEVGSTLAPEPAAEVVESPVTAVAELTPPPAPRVESPRPLPVPRPATIAAPTLVLPPPPVAAAPDASGPGERTARLTYNTVAFAALVVVGLLFVVYAVGVSSGRRRAAAETAAEAVVPARPAASLRESAPPPPPPPPPPAKVYTVWLAEWRYGANSERVKADDAVRQLKSALDRANLKGVEVMKVQRGAEPRLAMCVDRLSDPGSPETKARLAAFQKFKFGSQLPFAQASIVELPK